MFGIGNVLGTTFRIWGRRLPRFVVLVLLFHVLLLGWYALLWTDWGGRIVERYYFRPLFDAHPILSGTASSGMWIITTLLGASIALWVIGHLRGERVALGDAIAGTLRRVLGLFVVGLVVRMLTLGVLVLGAMLLWDRDEWYSRGDGTFIVWGVAWTILMSLLVAVVPALVVERRGPLSALARGFALGRGHRIKVFAIVLVGQVLYFGVYFLLYTFMIPSPYDDLETYRWRLELYGYVTLAVEALLASLWAVGDAVVYEKLREAKEGPAPSQLHSVFD